MDASQGKRSVSRKSTNKKRIAKRRNVYYFREVKGKRLESVEFSSIPEYNDILLRLQDKTCLNLVIDPGFTLTADYSDWKTGNQRIIRAWKPIRSA